MLSNDNDVADGILNMEVSEEVKISPTTHVAVTPAASLKPLAQTTSDDSASDHPKTLKMAKFSQISETSQRHDEHEELK